MGPRVLPGAALGCFRSVTERSRRLCSPVSFQRAFLADLQALDSRRQAWDPFVFESEAGVG